MPKTVEKKAEKKAQETTNLVDNIEALNQLLERVQNDFHKMYLDEMKRLEDLSIYGDSEISEDTFKTLKKGLITSLDKFFSSKLKSSIMLTNSCIFSS